MNCFDEVQNLREVFRIPIENVDENEYEMGEDEYSLVKEEISSNASPALPAPSGAAAKEQAPETEAKSSTKDSEANITEAVHSSQPAPPAPPRAEKKQAPKVKRTFVNRNAFETTPPFLRERENQVEVEVEAKSDEAEFDTLEQIESKIKTSIGVGVSFDVILDTKAMSMLHVLCIYFLMNPDGKGFVKKKIHKKMHHSHRGMLIHR